MKGAFQKVKKEDATGTKRYFRSKRTAGLNGHAANERGSHARGVPTSTTRSFSQCL